MLSNIRVNFTRDFNQLGGYTKVIPSYSKSRLVEIEDKTLYFKPLVDGIIPSITRYDEFFRQFRDGSYFKGFKNKYNGEYVEYIVGLGYLSYRNDILLLVCEYNEKEIMFVSDKLFTEPKFKTLFKHIRENLFTQCFQENIQIRIITDFSIIYNIPKISFTSFDELMESKEEIRKWIIEEMDINGSEML